MYKVSTSILINENNEILILKRSEKVRTYKGYWGGVAGYVEKNETPLETAYKEILEEVNLNEDDIYFLKQNKPIIFSDFYFDKKYEWKIYSFLFKCLKKNKISLDWEHIEFKWIPPSEIKKFLTVPYLELIVLNLTR
jgi:8-oxo-dGTP pyrophosphatase MutT (NUDIX family)